MPDPFHFFHFDGLPCLQNCPNGESEVIRSGCVEVVDDCCPTIYKCKLNSLAGGKREALDGIFIITVFKKFKQTCGNVSNMWESADS